MKTRLLLFTLLLLSVTSISKAETNDYSKTLLQFAGLEGVVIAHSWFLSRSPYAYGALSGAAYTAFGLESERGPPFWVSLGAAEGLNLYTMSMERNDISQEEIFKRNVIGWHVVFGITVASHVLLGKDRNVQSIKSNLFGFVPTDNGGELRIAFTF